MSRRDAGFTLMEVMTALAILGGSMVILLQAHHNALRTHGEMRDEAIMRTLTEQAIGMAEIELAAGNADGSGDFGERYPDHEYDFESDPIDEEQYPGLHEVIVTVRGPTTEQEMSVLVFVAGSQ